MVCSLDPIMGELLLGKSVLVVEDCEEIRELMAIVLSRNGAAVATVAEGGEAVTRASTGDYDLILLDLRLPDIDGHETLRRLRAAGTLAPVVALTADGSPEERERCRESGFDDFWTKPIALAALVERVQEKARDRERPRACEITG